MNKLTVVGVAALVILCTAGWQGLETLQGLAEQQQHSTEVVRRWKQSYRALATSTATWASKYPAINKHRDLLDVFATIGINRYGLQTDIDQLATTRIEHVAYNDVGLGLVRVCVASGGADANGGLLVTSSSYKGLLAGVNALASRPDIELGSVAVAGGDAKPTASISGFCLLMRQSDQ